jgi:hypothetical protein
MRTRVDRVQIEDAVALMVKRLTCTSKRVFQSKDARSGLLLETKEAIVKEYRHGYGTMQCSDGVVSSIERRLTTKADFDYWKK